jgi:hypothetical protein
MTTEQIKYHTYELVPTLVCWKRDDSQGFCISGDLLDKCDSQGRFYQMVKQGSGKTVQLEGKVDLIQFEPSSQIPEGAPQIILPNMTFSEYVARGRPSKIVVKLSVENGGSVR